MEQAPVQRIKYPGSIKKDDAMKDNYTIAQEVISGLWGNGTDRKSRLIKAGYNYENIQSIVNAIMNNTPVVHHENYTEALIYKQVELDLNKYDGLEVTIILPKGDTKP